MITYTNKLDALVPNVVVPGSKFYVNSTTGNNNNSGSKNSPKASIRGALDACTANAGDYIYVLPGYTQTVATAGALDIDVAGVTIVGLGTGTKRPTITLNGATTASITVTEANVTIQNFIFVGALDNVATCFTISAAACTIDNCEFRDTSSSSHFLSCILTDAVANSCDGLTVKNCKRFGLAAANTAFISILENQARVSLLDNFVCDAAATGDVGHFLIMADKVVTNAEIARNKVMLPSVSSNAVGQFMTGSSTTSTGVVHNNYLASTDTSAALFCTATLTFGLFENYQTGVLANSGLLWPGADTPS
jgi:hypothetical protein